MVTMTKAKPPVTVQQQVHFPCGKMLVNFNLGYLVLLYYILPFLIP